MPDVRVSGENGAIMTFIRVTNSYHRNLLAQQYAAGGEKIDPRNAFGTVVDEKGTPVICEHGGSMWLCAECADCILQSQ